MYRTFERIFAHRAKLDPLDAREEERRSAAGRRSSQGATPGAPRFDVTLDGVTVTAQPVDEGGATGWTGTDWGGWGSQGDGVENTGAGDSYDPAPTQAMDGPVLALLVCIGGLLGAGLTIEDVQDQAQTLLKDKWQAESDERQFQMYIQQAPEFEDPTERNLLEYEAMQSKKKYDDDVHQLAVKLRVSDIVMATALIGCAASLAAPTP